MADDQMNVGLLMAIAHRSMETRVYTELAAAGHADITVAQGKLAAQIAADGSRLTELAERAQVTKQTASFLVDQLEKAGYVERIPDPSDGRARLVRLSARGREMADVANGVAARVESEWAAHLGVRRMRQLRDSLERLREITDPYA
ncbi:MarR family transcriptional regulator [Nocardia otitidiscaviarum]|uniref:Benzoate anaerobic degradation regulator n=1 Tax=Nocardia otitidiscaviarum TaxID=1823 RepID=A0A378YTP7_9NOCA|nr:MarR family transcriptional regulator [Nocardia otitidiscaviarum]MBF6135045.1 MarR family transcriptional regulator [Nocardia otitidiscaviarum]MBF6237024.1 MarR family transcriptional regulator [Nocardia otitidiscaviarum]MBF6486868.1 MarR family transcriptional regulator [Nocardia otitidiscaviarum]SUA80168.1 Benzoate anaerobic degradation regulator [Nocardia otitidiscaviarum]